MINKNVQLLVFFIITFAVSVNAAPQATPAVQAPAATPAKVVVPAENEGTYRDEVESIKFDEYTGRDAYSIPFEDAPEKKPANKSAVTK